MPLKKFNAGAIITTRNPKRQLLAQKHSARHMDCYDRSTHFLHCSPFYQTPKILCFTMLYNQSDNPKVPFTVGSLLPDVIHVPWTYLTQHSKPHLDRFSHFCTAHFRESLYFTMCVKMWL